MISDNISPRGPTSIILFVATGCIFRMALYKFVEVLIMGYMRKLSTSYIQFFNLHKHGLNKWTNNCIPYFNDLLLWKGNTLEVVLRTFGQNLILI